MTRKKIPFRGYGRVEIAAGVTALPTPPVFVGSAADWNLEKSCVGAFDIEIYAASAVNLTLAELFGVVQIQTAIPVDTVVSVTNAADNIEATGHALLNGYGPIQFTGDDLPSGLVAATDYYVIYVDANNFQCAASLEDALEGTQVALADDGSGVMTFIGSESGDFLTGSNNSYAPRWMSYGLLGPANDGAIALTAVDGYTTRVEHRPRVVAYAVEATLSSAVATTIDVYPVQDAF